MKNLKDLKIFLSNLDKKVINDLSKAQRTTAQKICSDVQSLAPGNGQYSSSIKVSDTIIEGNTIKTSVYTDMTVQAKSTGNVYNLGFLLETGTNPHAIPNAFNWGVIYGYDSAMYKRTLKKDWHPGFVAIPHFRPALNQNKTFYKEQIKKILKEAKQ